MNLGPVDHAHGNGPDGYDLIGAIQGNAEKVLLLPIGQMLDKGHHIGRKTDLEN